MRRRSPLVFLIALTRCFSEIRDSVIGPIAIDVIDLGNRPSAIHEQPRQSVAKKTAFAQRDLDVPAGLDV